MRNFSVLSDVEFEELAADVLAVELATSVERFAAGPDGGIDLRWKRGTGIAQCKHYARSSFAQLLRAARKELKHVEDLAPTEYRFITSFDLSTTQKKQIYTVFERWMRAEESVMGGRDLDGLITRHEHVERRHPKLWLATGTQLFWSLHSDIANRTSAMQVRIEKSLPQYVVNRGYERARGVLDQHRVCVIAGVPGIGKTMLAHILVAHAMTLGYEPIEVSADIEEAWTAIDTTKPQIFFYDDFLGELSFSERLGKNEDRRLSAFIEKVRGTRTKLLVMTTREYVLKAAQQEYERLNAMDKRLHFVLALADYTRADRARILYNHLWHANLSTIALKEISGGGYREIIDHPGYNPRLIEYCTGEAFDKASKGYTQRVLEVLSHPSRLWRTAFEKHLAKAQQLLAITMATLPVRTPVEDLQTAHGALCSQLLLPCTTSDFRSGLAAMEGTFLTLERVEKLQVAAFHNPSIRDFVLDWIAEDDALLAALLASAAFFEQFRQLYTYACQPCGETVARPNFAGLLERHRRQFIIGIERTLHGPSPERRMQWTHHEGNVHRPPLGWFEGRMLFCLELPTAWRPNVDWLLAQITALTERWHEGEGAKAKAVELMRELHMTIEELPIDRRAQLQRASELAGTALDTWLRSSLDETEEDWAPYIDRFEQDHQAQLTEDRELVDEFEKFVRDEFDRWSPSPPHLDMLLSHAHKLNVRHEVLEQIIEAIREDEERDEQTAEKLQPDTVPPQRPNVEDADEALASMFRRLIRT